MSAPYLSTLAARMRFAAPVLREATERSRVESGNPADRPSCTSMELWCAEDLIQSADSWEAKDQEAAEREAVVEQLARELYAANRQANEFYDNVRDIYIRIARALVESGWRRDSA